jgi:thioredoxin reductase
VVEVVEMIHEGTNQEMQHDVVVVGGGPAGLSGAVTLARSRRSVLVVDAGAPRNASAEGIHNLLTSEGISPSDYARAGRAEAESYGAEVRDGRAVSAQVVEGGFSVGLADGSQVTARRLLVTSGVVDELPDVPGLRERWGRDVLHCPYCHGWEVRDRRVGVLASTPMAMHQMLLFRQLTDQVTLFLHDGLAPDDDQREQLAALDVTVRAGRVTGLEVRDGRLTGVRLSDGDVEGGDVEGGDVVPIDALVVQSRPVVRSELLASLGIRTVELEMGGVSVAEHVETDATGLTSQPGVWAAGNVAEPMAQVGASAAAGVRAAAVVNADLAGEDARERVQERRRTPVTVSR